MWKNLLTEMELEGYNARDHKGACVLKQKILLLSTGGTIASAPSKCGLRPERTGQDLLTMLGSTPYDITVKDILNMDSSNIQPEEWQYIAEQVYQAHNKYDGIVITHGTDTMAYTASVLTFMLPGITIPVILTGSQLPMTHPLSDAYSNIHCALAMAASGIPGIFIAFDRKILLGCRSVKVRTTSFNAFESINAPIVAMVNANGLQLLHSLPFQPKDGCELKKELDTHVVLVKLIPGIEPSLFRAIVDTGIHGVVVEAFGSGGLNFMRRDIASALGILVKQGIPVVVCSQCLYESSDFTKYEVGEHALQQGIIPGKDLTTECAVTKLMWALGQKMSLEEIGDFFNQ